MKVVGVMGVAVLAWVATYSVLIASGVLAIQPWELYVNYLWALPLGLFNTYTGFVAARRW